MLSDADRRRQYDAYGHEGLRAGGGAPNFEGFGSVSDLFSAFFGSGGFDGAFGSGRGARGGGAIQGADVVVAVGGRPRRRRARPHRRGLLRGRGALRALPRQRRRARHADRHVRALPRLGPAPGRLAHRVRPARAHRGLRRLRRRRPRAGAALRGLPRRRARMRDRAPWPSPCPAGIADGQRIRVAGRGHAGERGGPNGDLIVVVRVREDERFIRDGEDLHTVVDVAAPLAALGTTVQVPAHRRRRPARDPRGHAARRGAHAARPRHARRAAHAHRRPARARQRRHPAPALPRAARAAAPARRLAHRAQPRARTRACSPSSSARSRDDGRRRPVDRARAHAPRGERRAPRPARHPGPARAGRARARGAAAAAARRGGGDGAGARRGRVRDVRAAGGAPQRARHPRARGRRACSTSRSPTSRPAGRRAGTSTCGPVEVGGAARAAAVARRRGGRPRDRPGRAVRRGHAPDDAAVPGAAARRGAAAARCATGARGPACSPSPPRGWAGARSPRSR